MSTHIDYQLTLEEDTVLPSPAGRRTAGSGGGLDFVPGANLLGCVARSYEKVPEALRFDVFHSGRVRFGDARPIDALRHRTLPMPKVIERAKGSANEDWSGWRRSFPESRDAVDPLVQHKGVDGHLTAYGAALDAKKGLAQRLVLRTAVGFRSGRANDGQLFQMEALQAGVVFQGRISIDLPAPQAAEIKDLITRLLGTTVRLGRRKGAGQGAATLAILTASPPHPFQRTLDQMQAGGAVHLWCLSEVSLVDPATGSPTFVVRPEHFGLDPKRHHLDARWSTVRTCQWVPFNAQRQRPDVARLAIKAGSVVTFTGLDAADLSALRVRVARGVGLFRAEGLGEVLVQPAALVEPMAAFAARLPAAPEAADPSAGASRAPPIVGGSALAVWLQAEAAHIAVRQWAREAVEAKFEREFRRFAENRRNLPGPAQWAAVAGVARTYARMGAEATIQQLKDALFKDVDKDRSGQLRAPDARDHGRSGHDPRERNFAQPQAGLKHDRGLLRRGTVARRWFPDGRGGVGAGLSTWLDALIAEKRGLVEIALALGMLADRMAKGLNAARQKKGADQ